LTAPSGVAFVFAGILAMALAPSALGSQASSLPALMAGVYKTKFKNALVGGESYVSENILEIVPVHDRAVYFRIHFEFYNGHECAISGIAEASVDTLVYRGPADVDNHPCVLSLRRARDGVHVYEDENGACRNQTCGARGGYGFKPDGTADFPPAGRRRIRYLPRLLASDEYVRAVKEYASRSH
jgi:hypothetical protein